MGVDVCLFVFLVAWLVISVKSVSSQHAASEDAASGHTQLPWDDNGFS